MNVFNIYKDGNLVNSVIAEEPDLSDPELTWIKVEREESTNTPEQPILLDTPLYVGVVEFKTKLTYDERAILNTLKTSDARVMDFFNIIDDPRLTTLDLRSVFITEFLDYCILLNILAETRKQQILT